MKNKITGLLFVAFFSCSAVFVACKKDKSSPAPTTNNVDADASTQADDETSFATHFDEVANDVNAAVESAGTLVTGRTTSTICDATVVLDSTSTDRRLTITYDGSASCHPAFTRTGKVIITIPLSVKWKDSGAIITTNIDSVTITRLRDSKYFIMNGSHTVTNVKGGLLRDLASLGSIVHLIESAGITITFNDGTTRMWEVAKKREFNYSGGVVISTRGVHSDGTVSDIAVWGTNRKGLTFTREITNTIVERQDCDYRLVSGATFQTNPSWTAADTLGLDATGMPTSCPGLTGTYYHKTVWTNKATGVKRTIIQPY